MYLLPCINSCPAIVQGTYNAILHTSFINIKHCSGHAAKETQILALAPYMCIHKHVNLHIAALEIKNK